MEDLIQFLKDHLELKITESDADCYCSRSKRFKVQILIEDQEITSDSFEITNGEPDRSYF